MIRAGRFVLNEVNVAFHFMRRSVWEPWETIGVYMTCFQMARCRYEPKYAHIVKQFANEVYLAERNIISGSTEFLELWRKDHQDPTSVISPIINYCTASSDFPTLLSDLYTGYVGNNSGKAFARMAIMLKRRERFIAASLAPPGNQDELKAALREANLI